MKDTVEPEDEKKSQKEAQEEEEHGEITRRTLQGITKGTTMTISLTVP